MSICFKICKLFTLLINTALLGELENENESRRCLLKQLHSPGIKKLLTGRGRFVSTEGGSFQQLECDLELTEEENNSLTSTNQNAVF